MVGIGRIVVDKGGENGRILCAARILEGCPNRCFGFQFVVRGFGGQIFLHGGDETFVVMADMGKQPVVQYAQQFLPDVFAFALFFLAEYIFMILIGALTSIMFLGGWLSPFPQSWGIVGTPSPIWMFAKMAFVLYGYLWIRATFPRYRYDQIMRLGWKVLIPIGFVAIVFYGLWMASPWSLWK